jgi:hypothetical protein
MKEYEMECLACDARGFYPVESKRGRGPTDFDYCDRCGAKGRVFVPPNGVDVYDWTIQAIQFLIEDVKLTDDLRKSLEDTVKALTEARK